MRIAINCHPSQGGSGIVATELAIALAEKEHQVHIIACERPFRLPENSSVKYEKVYIPDYPLFKYPPHDFSLINKMVEVVRRNNIDIIHSHYVVPHAICGIFARMMLKERRTKVITTLHGTDITLVGSHPEFRTICQYAMNGCDALTSVSDWLSRRTCEEFTIEQPIHTIPNFVDLKRFNPVGRAAYPGDGEKFVLIHTSNFRPVKRVMDICRIFYQVQKELPARLKFVGKGPELGLAMELCSELGICSKVEIVGSMPDIETAMKQAHVFLLMSQYESFGLSALEALACGVPVAAARAGGLPEVFTNGVSGMMEPVGDIKGMAKRIIFLLSDRERWETMSQAAVKRSWLFSTDVVVNQYLGIYESLLT
ncbi:N-acetyl-alpha-D-glucosaminyl L-malate synthase BshA [bacterium]|nr:N-acetyl-alpha-D-glucosaminyl L-malate synthase BshA [bacterium]